MPHRRADAAVRCSIDRIGSVGLARRARADGLFGSAPPANIRAADLLQQPSSPAQPPESTDATAQPRPIARRLSRRLIPPLGRTAPPTTAEREQEFRKRIKEHADAEKKVADGQAQAAQKADDCQRARGYIKSLEDGVRLVRTNPDGSRELLDEAQRAAEAQRTREIIETRCN